MVSQVTSGTCLLTMTSPSGTKINQSAVLGLVSNYYACQGFEISSDQVAERGKWIVEVVYQQTDGVKSASSTESITVY